MWRTFFALLSVALLVTLTLAPAAGSVTLTYSGPGVSGSLDLTGGDDGLSDGGLWITDASGAITAVSGATSVNGVVASEFNGGQTKPTILITLVPMVSPITSVTTTYCFHP